MLNIRYDYFKIILLDKGHDYKHKHIQGGNGCLFLQDRHVICHSVKIFCIMTALSLFYHAYRRSGERCGL